MELTRELLSTLPMALRIEIEENALRKDLTQSELAHQQERILAELSKHKTPGTRNDLKPSTPAEPYAQVSPRLTGMVAKLFGESASQIERRAAVVSAAKADPEQFGKLKEDMDRTGHVNGPFKRLKVMRQIAAIRAAPPPLPGHGPYRVIIADPPWPYEKRKDDPAHRGTHPYPQMSIEQICELKVAGIAHKDCILWLWTTNHLMREAFTVLDAWGFEQKTILTWAKDKMGLGDWLRGKTEHCLLAVRGKPVVELKNQTTLLHGAVRKHSQKPVEFYDFVERLCPSPR